MLKKLYTVKVTDPVDEAISEILVTMHGISSESGQQQDLPFGLSYSLRDHR